MSMIKNNKALHNKKSKGLIAGALAGGLISKEGKEKKPPPPKNGYGCAILVMIAIIVILFYFLFMNQQ